MAPGRLYRDYSSDDDIPTTSPRRTPSLKPARELPSSPRTVVTIPEEHEDRDERAKSVGSPRTVVSLPREADKGDETEDASSVDEYYGAGTAHTTNGNHAVRSPEPHEPMLYQNQVDYSSDSVVAAVPLDIKPKRLLAHSVASSTRVSHDARSSESSGTKMPEFFSHAVFHSVLHNPTIAHQLLKFSQTRLCGENLEFLQKVSTSEPTHSCRVQQLS